MKYVALSRSKFGNRRTLVDGIWFDSEKEANRYLALKMAQKAGDISELVIHPRFDLVVNTIKISRYTADFQYIENGKTVVEDVKSPPTRKKNDYIMRRKLMLALHEIVILET